MSLSNLKLDGESGSPKKSERFINKLSSIAGITDSNKLNLEPNLSANNAVGEDTQPGKRMLKKKIGKVLSRLSLYDLPKDGADIGSKYPSEEFFSPLANFPNTISSSQSLRCNGSPRSLRAVYTSFKDNNKNHLNSPEAATDEPACKLPVIPDIRALTESELRTVLAPEFVQDMIRFASERDRVATPSLLPSEVSHSIDLASILFTLPDPGPVSEITMEEAKRDTFEDPYFYFAISIPTHLNFSFKVHKDCTMEGLLCRVCKLLSLSPEKWTLVFNNLEKVNPVEMDRTIDFYYKKFSRVPQISFQLSDEEKTYSMLSFYEGGEETMRFQSLSGKFELLAATFPRLLDFLIDPYFLSLILSTSPIKNANFVPSYTLTSLNVLFLTYWSFSKPEELLHRLISYFTANQLQGTENVLEGTKKLHFQAMAVMALGVWVGSYWIDFAKHSSMKSELDRFLSSLDNTKPFQKLVEAIHSIIKIRSEEFDKMLLEQNRSIQRSKAIESLFVFYSHNQIAEQLCLYNWKAFKDVHPIELLHFIWFPRDEEDSQTPSLDFFNDRFDLESYWVATEICSTKDFKKRIEVLSKFILVAKGCMDKGNFFSAFSLVAGLNLRPVERLTKTWKGLSTDMQSKYNEVSDFCSPSQNMKPYRSRLALATPPIIPFLPLFLKDLTFVKDGNPTYSTPTLINVQKLYMMSQAVTRITDNRTYDFPFKPIPQLLNYVNKPNVEKDFNKLKQWSLELEPT